LARVLTALEVFVHVLIVGVSDAFTRRGFGSSCVIRGQHGHVLIDCPDLIHRALHEASTAAGWELDVGDIDDIIITHLHGDHVNGLESFGFHRRFLQRKDARAVTPRLHVTQPVADRLWERLGPAMGARISEERNAQLWDFFDVRVISPDTPARIGGMEVRCRFTHHPVPTIGLLVSMAGRTLGWSGDTSFEQAHIDWLSKAHVIVHESNHGPAHTAIECLNTLPTPIRDKMRLIHLPDDFDPSSSPIRMLKAGELLDI